MRGTSTSAGTADNQSNDAQASVSGSDNALFGRIRTNADFSSSGQNIYYHYEGNGSTKPVPPSTVNDGKVTFRFLNANGDNFYETPLADPLHDGAHAAFTDGTWLPVQSDAPVGPVGVVTTDPYQLWPGNLHEAVTADSDYLEMNTASLEHTCDFGSLVKGRFEFDLTGDSPDGTYCTRGGLIKLSAQFVGTPDAPKRFTFLANNGLITISGQNAVLEPYALGTLAMSDLDSDADQFPIKIAGSNFSVQSQSIVFASRAGVDVSGSDDSLLCLHAIGQEIKLQGSTSDFGPAAAGCESPPSIVVTKTASPATVAEPGGPVTFSVSVQNTSGAQDPVTITSLTDDIHGDLSTTCTLPQTVQPGSSLTCSFTATVSGNAGDLETDTVTASGTDDDGNAVSGSDSATVTVTDVLPTIVVTKTTSPTTVAEPGGPVTFSVSVENTSNARTR